jgi:hypothetical protein
MRKLLLAAVVLAAANANAGSSKTFTDAVSGASIQVSDASGQSLNASGDAVSASGTFLADTTVAGWKLSKKIVLRTAEEVVDVSQASGRASVRSVKYVFTGEIFSDAWDVSKQSGKASVKITVAASKEARELASRLGRASAKGARLSGNASKVTVLALVDVSGTVLVTPSVASKALSEGRLADSAKVLLYLPSNIVEAAFGSDYHTEQLARDGGL